MNHGHLCPTFESVSGNGVILDGLKGRGWSGNCEKWTQMSLVFTIWGGCCFQRNYLLSDSVVRKDLCFSPLDAGYPSAMAILVFDPYKGEP